MAKSMIRFVNALDPSEIISVNDQDSAFILTRVLPKNWSIEGTTPTMVAPMDPTPIAIVDEAQVTPAPTPVAVPVPGSEFRVILISGTSTFRCATCEVALDHATLKNAAPAAFSGKECLAYISHHNMAENIELSCNVVTDSSGATRLEFVHPAKPELERLSEWMGATA